MMSQGILAIVQYYLAEYKEKRGKAFPRAVFRGIVTKIRGL